MLFRSEIGLDAQGEVLGEVEIDTAAEAIELGPVRFQIGRASCRERVFGYV